MLHNKYMQRQQRGFTLIELLVVIAVLGVLATVVIVAINPFQQLAKGRDAGRLTATAQLGEATVTYATGNNGSFVTANSTWITSLQTAGEVSVIPAPIAYSIAGVSACTTNVQNNICYKQSAVTGPIITYSRLEATGNTSRCASGQNAWAVYSSADGRGGIVCSAAEPSAGNQTFLP
jgi:prepilin-type N-terminal cleavage/methylation domain-containing protein